MVMDNYKEKYKKALAWMQGLYKGLHGKTKEEAEEVFLELKEITYDDVMRKMVIKAVHAPEAQSCIKSWGINPDDAIAWLEKQSTPQVRTGLEWVNTIDDACDKRYSEEYAHGEYCHEQSFKWGFQEGVDWLEKQGEQKPAWSEEDEEEASYIADFIENLLKKEKLVSKKTMVMEEMVAWLRDIKYLYLPKPEQGWGEEDEKMLNDIIMCGERHCYLDAGNIAWLKSLRPQNKGE